MAEGFVDPSATQGYHAHIYYDAETRPIAERLREAIGNRFGVELGRWREEPSGRIPCRCIRPHSWPPSSRALSRG